MPHWLLKSAIHHAIACLPRPERWNQLLQQHVTGSIRPTPGQLHEKLAQAAVHGRNWVDHGGGVDNRGDRCVVLEIGAGWQPIVPIALAVSGCGPVRSIDVISGVDSGRALAVMAGIVDLHESGRLAEVLPLAREDRVAVLADLVRRPGGRSASELLAAVGVHLDVGDPRATGLAGGSIDLIVSNNTLEHVPRDHFPALLGECRRLLSDRGMMSHYIDMRDHFARFDHTITVYNFLRYSERAWRLLTSPLELQNRMRLPEHLEALADAGFTVVGEDDERGPAEAFSTTPLAEHFRRLPPDQVAIVGSWLVARPS